MPFDVNFENYKYYKNYKKIAETVDRNKNGKPTNFSVEPVFASAAWLHPNLLIQAYFGYPDALDTMRARIADDAEIEHIIRERVEPYINDEPGREPYPNQKIAIARALHDPAVIITGPPGTGKTEMILNLLSVIYGDGQGDVPRTAVISFANEAVNNIFTELGYSMDEVNGGYVTGYDPDRVPPRFREMSRRFAVLGNMKFREAWFNYTG
nr:AAA family ATPase [Ruminiclostridium sp.]